MNVSAWNILVVPALQGIVSGLILGMACLTVSSSVVHLFGIRVGRRASRLVAGPHRQPHSH